MAADPETMTKTETTMSVRKTAITNRHARKIGKKSDGMIGTMTVTTRIATTKLATITIKTATTRTADQAMTRGTTTRTGIEMTPLTVTTIAMTTEVATGTIMTATTIAGTTATTVPRKCTEQKKWNILSGWRKSTARSEWSESTVQDATNPKHRNQLRTTHAIASLRE